MPGDPSARRAHPAAPTGLIGQIAQLAGVTSAQPDVTEQIAKLAALRDQGALTEDEFATKKAELLGRIRTVIVTDLPGQGSTHGQPVIHAHEPWSGVSLVYCNARLRTGAVWNPSSTCATWLGEVGLRFHRAWCRPSTTTLLLRADKRLRSRATMASS
jgi:hypothetical protein